MTNVERNQHAGKQADKQANDKVVSFLKKKKNKARRATACVIE